MHARDVVKPNDTSLLLEQTVVYSRRVESVRAHAADEWLRRMDVHIFRTPGGGESGEYKKNNEYA